MKEMESVPAGWHPDPYNPGQLQYWDGSKWTEERRPVDKKTQREAQRAAKEAQKNQDRAAKELQTREQAFWSSPQGHARQARHSGQRYFQIEIPLIESARGWSSYIGGPGSQLDSKTQRYRGQGATLSDIEDEGWELVQAGFVFHETGQQSRDKFLSSGQSVKTHGVTMGVYLFKATDVPARNDRPWEEPTQAAPQLGRATVREGWAGSGQVTAPG